MLHRLILKVTKFQLSPRKRLDTVVKNILGGNHAPPPMSNRAKTRRAVIIHLEYSEKGPSRQYNISTFQQLS